MARFPAPVTLPMRPPAWGVQQDVEFLLLTDLLPDSNATRTHSSLGFPVGSVKRPASSHRARARRASPADTQAERAKGPGGLTPAEANEMVLLR